MKANRVYRGVKVAKAILELRAAVKQSGAFEVASA
jgi:hypothetical protein